MSNEVRGWFYYVSIFFIASSLWSPIIIILTTAHHPRCGHTSHAQLPHIKHKITPTITTAIAVQPIVQHSPSSTASFLSPHRPFLPPHTRAPTPTQREETHSFPHHALQTPLPPSPPPPHTLPILFPFSLSPIPSPAQHFPWPPSSATHTHVYPIHPIPPSPHPPSAFPPTHSMSLPFFLFRALPTTTFPTTLAPTTRSRDNASRLPSPSPHNKSIHNSINMPFPKTTNHHSSFHLLYQSHPLLFLHLSISAPLSLPS